MKTQYLADIFLKIGSGIFWAHFYKKTPFLHIKWQIISQIPKISKTYDYTIYGIYISFKKKQKLFEINVLSRFYRKICARPCAMLLLIRNLSKQKVTATVLLQMTPNWIISSPLTCRLVWFNMGLIGWKLFVWLFILTYYFGDFGDRLFCKILDTSIGYKKNYIWVDDPKFGKLRVKRVYYSYISALKLYLF